MDIKAAAGEAVAANRVVKIDEAKARAHVLRPANLEGVTSSRGFDEGTPIREFKIPAHLVARKLQYYFDVDGFGQALHAALKDSVAGYVMQLRQGGNTIYTLQWEWAKRPVDGGEAWNPGVRMHIASVSKLITGIAMTRVLNEKQISYDTPIIGYLPKYWAKGPNIEKITFRQLMTHTSGFRTDTSLDYGYMKLRVAAGVNLADMNKPSYQNMNFGLCRILIPTANGEVATDYQPPVADIGFLDQLYDAFWDMNTVQHYYFYVQDHLFMPSGIPVNGPSLDHPSPDALAYSFPLSGNGWNSGDLGTASGGAGWHMSVDDLLNVMGTFRRKGTIMNKTQAQTMLDNSFGIDITTSTAIGAVYNKNGLWHSGLRTEQSLAYFLPEDMEMVLFANSPIGMPEKFFRDFVTGIYQAHVKVK